MKNASYLLDGLTPAQAQAVTYREGPLLIVAGPGSGKTEVISRRAAYLIHSEGVSAKSILVTTFTEKAALELKDRIQAKLPDINVEKMQVSTIHSFCHTLLEEFRGLTAFPHGLNVLDGPGQLLFVFTNRKDLGLSEMLKGRPCDFFQEVVRTYNLATEEIVQPDQLTEYYLGKIEKAPAKEQELWEERVKIARSYGHYLSRLQETESTDFANLQRHALDLLNSHPEVLSEVQQRFTDVLVDEYQDTNAVQDILLSLVAEPQRYMAVVGDDDQSIYRFRGATVRNILSFTQRYPRAKVVKLEQNFRSLRPIVSHSVRVISENRSRIEKNLVPVRCELCNDIILVHGKTAGDEANAVSRLLKHLRDDGTIRQYRDVAVLMRSVRSYAGEYLLAFDREKIPCVVTGDGLFFGDEMVSQLCDLLTFLGSSKPWADKFVRHPVMGLSPSTAEALRGEREDITSRNSPASLQELGISEEPDINRLLALFELKSRVQGRQYESFLEVLYALIEITGCFSRCQKSPDQVKNLGILV